MNDGGHGVANPKRGRKTGILAFLSLAVLAGALEWNWFAMPFERDEGEYAYGAWLLREGGVPYRDSFSESEAPGAAVEAVEWARRAVAAAPAGREASPLDTLATALARAGQETKAE